ncbi:PEP/pyruvate-binding domain-containing protein [Flavilitoribacter nigricans]|uniref:Phosphoenolpyruvate synthase n=1 Tax=Flavilitoribacter nigricans (strain ATCC 23147 / DSM 23189 / NBRC 102662 / NCIMB 1420 / SS-2) TaxID=1122177 RepID=A0A2D0N976_FLAN2|nr:PEP/pyruvate-binding domain-containing protein [Flavilitoribacter nigricans]PHN04699.1 phosphoenolpyruvate synthase [Flavilitoribacter nigricans DSM 23189 = NBRC 102662]
MKKLLILLGFLSLYITDPISAQTPDNEAIKELVAKYQSDIRGPFKDIRWFCKDGSVIPPKEKCPEPGGVQRARYKDEVAALAKNQHIFIGQILSNTPKEDFWDAANQHARLKQYQVEKYLRAVDDGWIWRKAQFYRGAVQVEDEENWGVEFFQWLLNDQQVWEEDFFLVRQAAKDIPHQGDNNRSQTVRALSKEISDTYLPFQDLRVKIHGQPEAADIQRVRGFRKTHQQKLGAANLKKMDQLLEEMELLFAAVDLNALGKYVNKLPKQDTLTRRIRSFIDQHQTTAFSPDRVSAAADLLWDIRTLGDQVKGGKARLALLDISNNLEEIIFKESGSWQAEHPQALLEKICYLGKAATGAGFLEIWEYETQAVAAPVADEIALVALNEFFENNRRRVEWGAGMTRAVYAGTVNLFTAFEPKAYGFLDDRVRASILLPLGQSVGQLGDFLAEQAGLSNQLMDLRGQSDARGLNPGYAMGELVIVEGFPEELEVDKNKIYVFERPPADLKPVAGIATVSEGNMVSHVQLLARNLGIPNAVVSNQNLDDLRAYAGQTVFYAVSNKGTIIMKPAASMTQEEQQLFTVKQRSEQRISVPVDKIRLEETRVLNLRELKASDSGKLCGPKAANLGQLKQLFPDKVVEGLVIPFGIFRQHLDQTMPGTDQSYWEHLNGIFRQAAARKQAGAGENEIEAFMLEELDSFRKLIKEIALLPEFEKALREDFQQVLGGQIGSVPVFLRSDTNMEDLKEFTGAGLNLTLFNVVDAERIWQGIKDVWASPYTERSYKWRQRYLLNPENVFPSILIIPSVDVAYSGVMITKGVTTGRDADITIAFSRGAGGAVDGQIAESYLMHDGWGNQLLSPAREPYYNRLPETGGTKRMAASFEDPILSQQNLDDLRELAAEVKKILPEAPGVETDGPFDIELGFRDDKIWLFQVRPFVENKGATASTYLESITPVIPDDKMVNLKQPL